MKKYICEVLVRKDKSGNFVHWGGALYSEAIIVQASSETFVKDVARHKYAKEHGISTSLISIGKVTKM